MLCTNNCHECWKLKHNFLLPISCVHGNVSGVYVLYVHIMGLLGRTHVGRDWGSLRSRVFENHTPKIKGYISNARSASKFEVGFECKSFEG
jgi:hypothetical protein